MTKLFVDTETYKQRDADGDYYSKQKAYLIGACDDYGDFMYWRNTSDFIKALMDNPEEEIQLYFFNATYDLEIIVNDFLEFGYNINPRPLVFDESKNFVYGHLEIYYTEYEYDGKKIKRDDNNKTVKRSQKMKKIIVNDLWMFDRSKSIDKWTKQLFPNDEDKHKSIIDYDKCDVRWEGDKLHYFNEKENLWKQTTLEDELDYLKRDVLVMPHILEYKENLIKKTSEYLGIGDYTDTPVLGTAEVNEYLEAKKKNPLTIPSIMKKATSMYMMKQGQMLGYTLFRPEVDAAMYEIMENSYLGGYTFQNNTKEEWENVWKLDVNSEYPYQEYSRPMPVGLPTKTKPDGEYIKWIMVKIKGYEFNKKYAFLSTMLIPEYKLNKKMFLTEEYFNLLQEKGNFIDLEIYGVYYTATTRVMNEIIDKLYTLKSEAPSKEVRTQSKLLINSSYGAKAMKAKVEKYQFEFDHVMKTYQLVRKRDENAKFYSNLGGVYIAQSARLTLFEGIDACLKGGDVVLGDTDSVFTTADPFKTDLKIDKKEIGAWDIESVFEQKCDNHNTFDAKCENCKTTPRPYSKLKYVDGIRKKYYAWYEEDKNQVSLAYSGIPTSIVLSLSHEDRLIVFEPSNNIVFKEAKKASKENIFGQKQIYMTDFMSNNKIEPTHECVRIGENKWVLEEKQ